MNDADCLSNYLVAVLGALCYKRDVGSYHHGAGFIEFVVGYLLFMAVPYDFVNPCTGT